MGVISKVSEAIISTPNASDYVTLVAKNAVRALRDPPDAVLSAIHGCFPDTPDRRASAIAINKWHQAIDAILADMP